ncbi:MAG: TauD/TfdA family dioxygenase [Alphaproteobacteria bacterium]
MITNGEIEILALSPAVGAEIRGVDLALPLNDEIFTAIYGAWLERGVLRFRGQRLSDANLVAFSRRFGELDLAPVKGHGQAAVEGIPEIFIISNVIKDGVSIGSLGDSELLWHTDMAYTRAPPKASCLYSLNVTESGGETGYIDMYTAYQALPADLRQRIEGRAIKHDSVYTLDGYRRDGSGGRLEADRIDVAKIAGPSHPITRTHPETGRKALYLGRRQNTHVNGLTIEESEALLDMLWDHVAAQEPAASWHHRWRVGDLLIWDNRRIMHRRNSFSPDQRRIMHRTQIKGDKPV